MEDKSYWLLPCECGRLVKTAEPEAECACGRLLVVRGWGEYTELHEEETSKEQQWALGAEA